MDDNSVSTDDLTEKGLGTHCAVCTLVLGKRYLRPRQQCGFCDQAVCGGCSPSVVQLPGQKAGQRACVSCIQDAHKASGAKKGLMKLVAELNVLSGAQDVDRTPSTIDDAVTACDAAVATCVARMQRTEAAEKARLHFVEADAEKDQAALCDEVFAIQARLEQVEANASGEQQDMRDDHEATMVRLKADVMIERNDHKATKARLEQAEANAAKQYKANCDERDVMEVKHMGSERQEEAMETRLKESETAASQEKEDGKPEQQTAHDDHEVMKARLYFVESDAKREKAALYDEVFAIQARLEQVEAIALGEQQAMRDDHEGTKVHNAHQAAKVQLEHASDATQLQLVQAEARERQLAVGNCEAMHARPELAEAEIAQEQQIDFDLRSQLLQAEADAAQQCQARQALDSRMKDEEATCLELRERLRAIEINLRQAPQAAGVLGTSDDLSYFQIREPSSISHFSTRSNTVCVERGCAAM